MMNRARISRVSTVLLLASIGLAFLLYSGNNMAFSNNSEEDKIIIEVPQIADLSIEYIPIERANLQPSYLQPMPQAVVFHDDEKLHYENLYPIIDGYGNEIWWPWYDHPWESWFPAFTRYWF